MLEMASPARRVLLKVKDSFCWTKHSPLKQPPLSLSLRLLLQHDPASNNENVFLKSWNLVPSFGLSCWNFHPWTPNLKVVDYKVTLALIISTKIWNLSGGRQSSTSLSFNASVKLNAMQPLKMVEIPLCWPEKTPWCSTWEKSLNTACTPWAPLCKNSQAISRDAQNEFVGGDLPHSFFLRCLNF